jgi:hypothetical protein
MSDQEEVNYPAQCLLHNERLKRIDTNVDAITGKLDALLDLDGPISRMQQRLVTVEGTADRAHERIDDTEIDIKTVSKSYTSLALKVAGIMAPLAAAIGAVVSKVL